MGSMTYKNRILTPFPLQIGLLVHNAEVTGDLRPERAQRADAARRPC